MLNPLAHPICLSYPLRLAATAWAEHIPFAMFLVDVLRPKTVVELGTFSGVSYCAFCQAVKELNLDSRCYAVDTWKGDPQSGFFGPEVLEDLKQHHDPLYGEFSTLIQSTFDEAVSHFVDGTIDLLHIDGYHTYEVVKHDFENWLLKMSSRGVVLLHDVNVRESDFGVWRLWEELKLRYPYFEFIHEHGLGLLAVGETYPASLQRLFKLPEAEGALVREFFYQLGQRFRVGLDKDHAVRTLSWKLNDKEHVIQLLTPQLAQKDEAIEWLSAKVNEKEQSTALQLSEKERVIAARDQTIGQLSQRLASEEPLIAARDETMTRVRDELAALREETQLTANLNESLRAQLADYKRAAHTLQLELEGSLTLATQLSEKERVIQYHLTQVADREKIIQARDEAISWLRAESAESAKRNQRLRASSDLLRGELVKQEQGRQRLLSQLAAIEVQLERIVNSIGWRLLTRYGLIKYRYLLPVYRILGLSPGTPKNPEQPVTPHSAFAQPFEQDEPSTTSASWQAVTDHSLLGDVVEQVAQSEREQPEWFDSYSSLTLLARPREEELAAVLEGRPPTKALRRADVICFSIIDWEFRYQRPQQIMAQFAANGHRVFYISTTRFQSPTNTARALVSKIKENVYEVQLAADRPLDVYSEVIDGNSSVLLGSLEGLRRTFHIDEAVAYVMIASWGNLALEAARLWNWSVVYDCMDEWENFPGIKRALLEMEVKLVESCDLLVVTARRLYEKWRPYKMPMVLARNAVDYEFYDQHYGPNTRLSGIEHPIVGYYGAIADWFDVELLAYVARKRPDYNFVLLGGTFNVDVSALKSLPNVSLLGQQTYETMPQYLYHFDVCIIPFKLDPITEATDPVKLYEYLSGGKPVVSVALPELERFRDYLYIASDKDEFVSQLDRALAEEDRDLVTARRELARQNTWSGRYKLIEAGLRDTARRASIILVTYDNLALNKLCLESIIRNTEYPNYEVVVVDNKSTDGTPAYLRYMTAQYSNIQIILNGENSGFARATNQGIARSTGDYIVLLNNDTVVPPGWLTRLLRHLRDPAIGMVGPVTNFVGNEAKVEAPYRTWGEMETFAAERAWAHCGEVADISMLAMFCVAFRRDTYELVGPLDEQFGIGMFEDDDYAQRVREKGYRVICATDVFVHHFGQAAFKKLIERGQYDELFDKNRRLYEAKWNVKWIPHNNAPLSLGSFGPSTLKLETTENN